MWGRRRKKVQRVHRTFKMKMSEGWWLGLKLTYLDGTGSEYIELLVEPDEIGPILNALGRNGIERGRNTKLRYGVGQTPLQRANAQEAMGDV